MAEPPLERGSLSSMPGPDPWRRAYTLSRTRQARLAPAGRGDPHAGLRQSRPVWPWVTLLLLAAGGAGWFVWHDRGVLIPKYAPQLLPPPVAQTVARTPLPRQALDIAALDGGAGIGLAIGGEYLNLIAATRPWGVRWKLTERGGGRARLDTTGLTVRTEGSRISGYDIDIPRVFKDEKWLAWRKPLAETGLSPELNWRTATGEALMPHGMTEHVLTGRGGLKFGSNPATTAYTLYFRDGWLQRVEAGLSTGNIQPPLTEHSGRLSEPPPAVKDDGGQPPAAPPPAAGKK